MAAHFKEWELHWRSAIVSVHTSWLLEPALTTAQATSSFAKMTAARRMKALFINSQEFNELKFCLLITGSLVVTHLV